VSKRNHGPTNPLARPIKPPTITGSRVSIFTASTSSFKEKTINLEALFDGSNPFEEGGSVHYTADDVSPNEPAF